MKILKAKVRKERGTTSCRFFYPDCWDTKKIHVLAWGPGKGMGEQIEECLCVADDAVAEKLVVAGEAVELSRTQANLLGKTWRPQTVFISREDIVIPLVAKLLKKKQLTKEEADALNPDESAPGINKHEFDIDRFFKE